MVEMEPEERRARSRQLHEALEQYFVAMAGGSMLQHVAIGLLGKGVQVLEHYTAEE